MPCTVHIMLDAEDIIKKWTAAELPPAQKKENNTRAIAVKTEQQRTSQCDKFYDM